MSQGASSGRSSAAGTGLLNKYPWDDMGTIAGEKVVLLVVSTLRRPAAGSCCAPWR